MFQGVGRTGAEPEGEDTEEKKGRGKKRNSHNSYFIQSSNLWAHKLGNPNTKRSNEFINHATAFRAPRDRQMCLSTNNSPVNSCQFKLIRTDCWGY